MAEFVVAVTGGVASGKSAVTRLFESLGVVVADADLAARAVVAPGQPALAAIAARFGPGVLLANGMLNRVLMRKTVFDDPDARRDLEAILHPGVRTLLREWCASAAGPYVLAAIPLLAESSVRKDFAWLRRVLVVDAPEALQLQRLMARDGITKELASKMIGAQAPRRDKLAVAADVIVNNGTVEALKPAVARLDELYRRLALPR